MRKAKKVTKNNCAREVKNSPLPVLLDFYADWCEPCKEMEPIIKNLASEFKGRLKVCKVDVEKEPELCEEYGIQSIPTILLFSDGEVITTFTGSVNADVLKVAVNAMFSEE